MAELPQAKVGPDQSGPAAHRGVGRTVRVEFGRRWVWPAATGLKPGSIVELDAEASGPVDVYADGRLMARGSACVMGGRLCVRVEQRL